MSWELPCLSYRPNAIYYLEIFHLLFKKAERQFKKAHTSPEVCQERAKKNKDYLQYVWTTKADVLGYITHPVKEKIYTVHLMFFFIFLFLLEYCMCGYMWEASCFFQIVIFYNFSSPRLCYIIWECHSIFRYFHKSWEVIGMAIRFEGKNMREG